MFNVYVKTDQIKSLAVAFDTVGVILLLQATAFAGINTHIYRLPSMTSPNICTDVLHAINSFTHGSSE